MGLAILEPLRELDVVAYLRFASVYRSFESLADFEAEITALRAERHRTTSARPASASQTRTDRRTARTKHTPRWTSPPRAVVATYMRRTA